ncbi:hypothetical protein BDY19DRAFT_910654 [Irpex rosettiformis]|uniref:Uncharacterized protein n=1 Tax=Irpex rosettiformis TaxID=378272 RepID=A0ACB8TN42_9APHY|nr:hypothetical protein BDY19DRAFT_910654 [Irpex rosettiformis]
MSNSTTSDIPAQLQNIIPLSSTNDVFATQIITNYLIYDPIFSAASPGSILRLARTCKAAHAAMRDYFSRAFDINNHLSRFFDDPLAFRSLQAQTNTLISGSFALQFFDRSVYQGSDLNLYVPSLHHKEIGRWLVAHGYEYVPGHDEDVDDDNEDPDSEEDSDENRLHYLDWVRERLIQGFSKEFSFQKRPSSKTDETFHVRLTVVTSCPMEVILGFHSTAVLNVISWDRAYSLYPRATFEHRKSLLLLEGYTHLTDIIEKYSNRNFEFVRTLDHPSLTSDPALASTPRWIGDGYSWILDLPTNGITLPPPLSKQLTRDPCYLTTWRCFEVVLPWRPRSMTPVIVGLCYVIPPNS